MIALLASCTEFTVKITDETTELPNKVVKALDDTTLVKQYAIIETDDKLYLLTKKDTEKKFSVEKTVDKTSAEGVAFLLGFIFTCLIFMIIIVVNS